ncbi:MAG: DUF933 domain-containing protein [Chitinivibrionales bacterium]|nr:DUF933 domain-containing protein [Chitinivibrionales bacterium]
MKIAFTGLSLPEGKRKFDDDLFAGFVEKFRPAKVSPYYFEFVAGGYFGADVIAATESSILDVLILDMEKLENRLSRVGDSAERAALEKCLAWVEDHRPVCDMVLDERETAVVRGLGLVSFTPTLVYTTPDPDANTVCRDGMGKAGMMFFYTVGPQEVHAWLVRKNADAVTCAGKIHTHLAQGFIRAEIISCADMMQCHSMQDARKKGMTRLVERDFPIPEETILDIRFNV